MNAEHRRKKIIAAVVALVIVLLVVIGVILFVRQKQEEHKANVNVQPTFSGRPDNAPAGENSSEPSQ